MLDTTEQTLEALGLEQEDQIRRLRSIAADDNRGLLALFQAAYPNANFTLEEEVILGRAASAAEAVQAEP